MQYPSVRVGAHRDSRATFPHLAGVPSRARSRGLRNVVVALRKRACNCSLVVLDCVGSRAYPWKRHMHTARNDRSHERDRDHSSVTLLSRFMYLGARARVSLVDIPEGTVCTYVMPLTRPTNNWPEILHTAGPDGRFLENAILPTRDPGSPLAHTMADVFGDREREMLPGWRRDWSVARE